MLNQKTTGKAMSIPAGIAVGAAAGIGLTVMLCGLLAKLVDAEIIPWESIGYGIMGLLLLSSFSSAITAYSKIKRQRMLVCAVSGAVYFCFLLSVTALFFGGQYEAVGVTAALVFGGSITAGLLGLHNGGGNRRKHQTKHR